MPSGMVGSSSSSCVSTITLDAPGTLGDTYGGNKFFSSSVSFVSAGGGGTELALWDFGIFAGGLEELGRSTLGKPLGAYTCTPSGCPRGRVASTCVC